MAIELKLERILGGLIVGAALGSRRVMQGDTVPEEWEGRWEHRRLKYPVTRTVEQTDDYHGTSVADPYRWLEDANSDDTKAWVAAQNELTFAYLHKIQSRDAIRERLTVLWDYERFGLPHKEGSYYFYTRNSGLQNQAVLYVADDLQAEGRILLDPNTLSEDGTVALSGVSVSEDGRHLAYGLSSAGSDWQEWRVRDVATGEDLPDHLRWVKFSGASWDMQNEGFYYCRYDEPAEGQELQQQNYYQKVYYHRHNTEQAEDTLIYHRDDEKEWGFGAGETEDGQYLILYVSQGTEKNNRIFYRDLSNGDNSRANAPMVELLAQMDASYSFVGNDGAKFYVRTDKDAPLGRLVAIDLSNPDPANWQTVIAESSDKLQGVSLFGNEFIALYLKDAHSVVRRFALDGSPISQNNGEIALPGLGTSGGFGGRRDATETFYLFTSYTTPTTIYCYDLQTGESTLFKRPTTQFDGDKYITRQVFLESKDKTRIPMFLTYRRGLELNGDTPTYLYGYGGFNASLTPSYSPTVATWLEMGGIYASVTLRGGGEYGESWYNAGRRDKKQNVFDDFIAAAEWLTKNDYTNPDRLAIAGGSNGGLLVGACLTQKPELFGAALPAVGVMDMLRFNQFTIGWAWASDYGEPDKSADDFKTNYAYSPLHNIKPGTRYPATLITTSDHDDRVVPAHSYKFAAALQAAQVGDAPTLIRIETKAGHGAGKPTAKIIEEVADSFAFLTRALRFDLRRGFGKEK